MEGMNVLQQAEQGLNVGAGLSMNSSKELSLCVKGKKLLDTAAVWRSNR